MWENREAGQRQLKWYTPHGPSHFAAVETLLSHLLRANRFEEFSEYERFLLVASAWLHDIGMLRGVLPEDDDRMPGDERIRDQHHIRSEKYLQRRYRDVGVKEQEVTALSLLARFHRRHQSPGRSRAATSSLW